MQFKPEAIIDAKKTAINFDDRLINKECLVNKSVLNH